MSRSAAVKRICPSWVLTISDHGPEPVSAVKPANFNPEAVAGLYASTLGPGCVDPAFAFFKPVDKSLPQSGNEADCHGVWGVNDERSGSSTRRPRAPSRRRRPSTNVPRSAAAAASGGRNLRVGAVVDDCSACEC